MTPDSSSRRLPAWLDHYGMAGVLVLLCLYYSWATNKEQQPRGATAAKRTAAQINAPARGATVLIAGRTTAEDTNFVTALEARLVAAGCKVEAIVLGEPRDARQALQRLATEGKQLDFIAVAPGCGAWTVFEDLKGRFPALGEPQLVFAKSYRWPTFLNAENLLNIANQIAVVAILAAGMTVVIITGGIDLSVGSLIALSAVLASLLLRDVGGGVNAGVTTQIACSAAGVVACAAFGALSGAVITRFKVPPFIATLGVMLVASGLAFKLARGQSIYELPETFTWLGRGKGLFSIPHAVLLMALIYIATHLMMSRTALGRRLYAVGGNEEAARLSGVRVGRVRLFAYIFCGALAGLGGVLLASQLKSGSPTYGLSYELDVIAAVVVGGASLSGGEGRIFGSLIGSLIIAVIRNGMNLTGVESYDQKVVLGLVILGAVLLDQLKRRSWRRSQAKE
jgi:ribose transport system permease protein